MGGILPVIAFSVIEDQFGILWGVVAGMVFGVGEIIWEKWRLGKVDPITWGGNGMILVLGGVSFWTQDGLWFKLQPALMEAAFALVLWGTSLSGRPLMVMMARKQGTLKAPEPEQVPGGPMGPKAIPAPAMAMMEAWMGGLNWRLGVFFALHAVLATWAALKWSTAAWGVLKGVGFTLSMVVYMVVETVLLRYRIATKQKRP